MSTETLYAKHCSRYVLYSNVSKSFRAFIFISSQNTANLDLTLELQDFKDLMQPDHHRWHLRNT